MTKSEDAMRLKAVVDDLEELPEALRAHYAEDADGRHVLAVEPVGVTIRRGAETIARVEPGGSIWISNNLPYVAGLEHGGANRAPAAMVRTTLAEVRARLGGG